MKLSDTDIEYYYNRAIQSYNNILPLEIEEVDKGKIILRNKSISMIYDHVFLPAPLLEVSLDLMMEGNYMGYYKIYLNKDNTCIDDVFFLH